MSEAEEQQYEVEYATTSEFCPSLTFEDFTEGGNASRLERLCGNDMRYCHTFKKWYIWDGQRWQVDNNGSAMRKAEMVVKDLYNLASKAGCKADREDITKFAHLTDSRKGLSNMLAIAANRATFAITSDKLDANLWVLGCENYTIDLTDCMPYEPKREDLITKSNGIKFDFDAECPLWINFLNQIFNNDNELVAYIQRAVGYSLTGTQKEQVFFMGYGEGSNGKTVFTTILMALLGEYAQKADFSTFLHQGERKIRNDLAALAGARVIVASEAKEGAKFSLDVIKDWTGGGKVTCRYLFGEYFTYVPEGKLWIETNPKPIITEQTFAAWRRVQAIPFSVTIPKEEQDRDLIDKLRMELPGILNWALEGLAEYHGIGLATPEIVKAAVEEYRKENDSLTCFISECCEFDKLKTCTNKELYEMAYKAFCGMSGMEPLSQPLFSKQLNKMFENKGVKSKRSKHGMAWIGIDLNGEWKGCRVQDEVNQYQET